MDSSADFAAPLDAPVSVVIAGGGKITAKHLSDLMDDWIRLGTPDQVDTRVWLPADKKYCSQAVAAAAEWAQKDGCPGNSVVTTVEQSYQQVVFPCGEGQFTISAEESGTDVATTLITALEEDNREEQRVPYVVLAWGEADDPPDEFTAQLLELATQAGISVLEISAHGLQVWGGPEEEEEPFVEPETELAQQSAEQPVEQPADEAQAIIEQPVIEPDTTQPKYYLMDTLRRCERLVQAEMDRHEALFDEPGECDLMHAIVYFQKRVRNEGPEAVLSGDDTPRVEITTISPEAEQPSRKGRPRAAQDEVTVYLAPDGVKAVEKGFQPGIGEILPARGRIRAGWVRRSVERDLIPAGVLKERAA